MRLKFMDALRAAMGGRKAQAALRQEPHFGRAAGGRGRRYEGYEGSADTDDLRNWGGDTTSTPNFFIAMQGDKIRARARDAARNNALISGYLARCVRSVVGSTGFRFRPADDMLGKDKGKHEALFKAHAKALAIQSQRKNFTEQMAMSRLEFEQFAVRSLMRDGEVLLWRLRNADNETGYTIRVLDPDMIAASFTNTNTIGHPDQPPGERVIAGVGLDARNRVKAFYLRQPTKTTQYSILWTYQAGELIRVPADDILLLYRQDWTNQVRGVSPLDVVLRDLQALLRYQRLVQLAARKNASAALVVETQSGEPTVGQFSKTPDEKATYDAATDADGRDGAVIDINGMTVPVLNQNEKIVHHSNNFPGETVEPYISAVMRTIAVGLNIAPVGVTGDYSSINFSAGQLMHRDDEEHWRMLQALMCELHRWWHNDWCSYAIQRGSFRDMAGNPVRLNKSNLELLQNMAIIGRTFTPVDELKQANAYKVLLEAGVYSIQHIHERMGVDTDEIFAQRKREDEEGMSMFVPGGQAGDMFGGEGGEGDEGEGGKPAAGKGKKPAKGGGKNSV